MNNNIKEYIFNFIPYIILSIISVVLFSNFFYGYDAYDEGLYISNIYRFLQGDKPFVNDWTGYQAYAPLFIPLFRLFLFFNHSTDGIILFGRMIHFSFLTIVSFSVYCILKKAYEKKIALISAIFIILFCKSNIYGLSYYSFGFLNLTLGMVFFYKGTNSRFKNLFSFLSGIFIAFSALFNLYVVPLYFIYVLFILIFPKFKIYRKAVLFCCSGIVLVALIYFLLFVSHLTKENINMLLMYINNNPFSSSQGSLVYKTFRYFANIGGDFRWYIFPMFVVFFIGKFIFNKKYSFLVSDIMMIINISLFLISHFVRVKIEPGISYVGYAIFTFFTIIIYSGGKKLLLSRELFIFIIPGVLLSIAFRWASDQRLYAIAIGFTLVMLASPLFSYKVIEKGCFHSLFIKRVLFYIPTLFTLVFTFFLRTNNAGGWDNKLPFHVFFIPSQYENLAKITDGPYKGIYTSVEHKIEYDNICNSIMYCDSLEENSRIAIGKRCPFAYCMLINNKPGIPDLWQTRYDDFRIEKYFDLFGKPDIFFVWKDSMDYNYYTEYIDYLSKNNYSIVKIFSNGVVLKK